MTRLAVIGGGAAGVCAAIAAARAGASVTVLERSQRPLRKLCVTGNGRGNLMNMGENAYFGDAAFADRTLEAMPREEIRAFLQSVGATLTTDAEGRVYPAALMASVVADALTAEMARLNVRVCCDRRATAVEPRADSGFAVRGIQATREPDRLKKSGKARPGAILSEAPFTLQCDRALVAVGGAASPAHGTDGGGYALLTALGHRLITPRPALCALQTETAPIAGLAGQRVRARLMLTDAEGHTLRQSEGEALFTEDGVSGIAAMQLARFATQGCTLRVDMRRAVIGDADADARAWLAARAQALDAKDPAALLTGAVTPALNRALVGYASDRRNTGVPATDGFLHALADAISGFSLRVLGTRGWEQAQVTAGGIATQDFDPATLQSKLVPGLYAAGEALDVDGDCGGYNLMFAFASGLLAGKSAAGAFFSGRT